MALLDLLGVALIAVIAALSIRGVQSQSPSAKISFILNLFHLDSFSFQVQAGILGVSATIFLILKTVLTMVTTKRILYFLGRKSAEISNTLTEKFLASNIVEINSRSVADTQYALGYGVNSIALGILGLFATVIADATLLIVISIGVLIIDPLIAISSLIMFAGIGMFLYYRLHKKARTIGQRIQKYSVESNRLLEEVVVAFREVYVRARLKHYSERIGETRSQYALASADQIFLPNVSKYVLESSVILGAMFVSAIQFAIYDAVHAAAGLALFMAAGSRIAPALLRIQQSLITIQTNIGTSEETFELIERYQNAEGLRVAEAALQFEHNDFSAEIKLSGVTFRHSGANSDLFKNSSLVIPAGSFTAIVGPSGSGKTTFADLVLGIHKPNSGSIEISGLAPLDAILKWPGAISYVPQDVSVFSSSIAENIALGFEQNAETSNAIKSAIAYGHFPEDFLRDRIDSREDVGPSGSNLSGGQRQRIGLARAMFTNPRLLILDEATSSLDSNTEAAITQSLKNLHGQITLLVIAHRLSTVREADQVVYLDSNGIRSVGTFDEVRRDVPDFDRQAKLMGL
jgi:ABC-type bacteriocin/lantibiotic exporter with double-glycine peptidase domain